MWTRSDLGAVHSDSEGSCICLQADILGRDRAEDPVTSVLMFVEERMAIERVDWQGGQIGWGEFVERCGKSATVLQAEAFNGEDDLSTPQSHFKARFLLPRLIEGREQHAAKNCESTQTARKADRHLSISFAKFLERSRRFELDTGDEAINQLKIRR